MSIPLPPVNVTQVPLFRTTSDSTMFEMNTLLQCLPPPSTVPGMPANMECVTNIKKCLTVGGNVLLANNFNLDLVNRAIMLVFSSIQEIEDRVKADHSKHLVAQKSVFGWKFVSSLLSMGFVFAEKLFWQI